MDEQLSCDGDDGHFCRFSSLSQPLINRFDIRIVSDCAQRGHVECASWLLAACADAARAVVGTAVIVLGSQADQAGDIAPAQTAQFGQIDEKAATGFRTHAHDGLHDLAACGKLLVSRNQGIECGGVFCDPAVDHGYEGSDFPDE